MTSVDGTCLGCHVSGRTLPNCCGAPIPIRADLRAARRGPCRTSARRPTFRPIAGSPVPGYGLSRTMPWGPLQRVLEFPTLDGAARALGVSLRTVTRYKAHGIGWRRADELAVHLGLHPAEIWPREWVR